MSAMSEAALGRLEAVVSRLEAFENQLSMAVASGGGGSATKPSPSSTSAPTKTAAVAAQAPGGPAAAGSCLATYDDMLANQVSAVVEAGKAVGGGVQEVSEIFCRAFEAERKVVAAMTECQKPSDSQFQVLLTPVSTEIEAAQAKTRGRRTAEDNHYKVVAESLGALSWVCYQPGTGLHPPPQHIDDALQSCDFYANKILMEHRQTGPNHVAWVKACKAALAALKTFTKTYYSTGPAWNASGVPLGKFGGGPAPAKKGGPPPPAAPPPPPPGLFDDPSKPSAPSSTSSGAEGLNAVFAELQAGGGVTAGLRKVTNDMKAKNREDKTGFVSAPEKPAAKAQSKWSSGASPAGPPVLELQNHRRWVIENQRNNREIVIDGTNPKQSVYVYNCEGCTIQVKGKLNAISIDGCKKTGVVFDNLVASCEVVNSKSVQLQVTGHCATFAVDKCDGLQVYLSEESLGAEVISAKSSELNIITPGKTPEDEMVEHFIPEQFVSKLVDGKFVTTAVCHSAG
eukprot:CAMPEP_0117656350 /NCGR_PEP_ID=MMETSP0804-20121206/4758_1 /TAXON_ID=1074897 /ORGANISM="Tetraselmis astigmatica, Strain CCMP880" /LENGTH=511 /DNA_ID=CAMNT_0005462747 /DNA_START=139 /DNA_END=1674 /DNA_ORIENTATION=+